MILAKEWVVAGGVRSLRRRESNGEGSRLRGVLALHGVPIDVGHMLGFWPRQFDSSEDAVPTLALYERPTVSKTVVRPLTTAHQFTQVQNTGYNTSFARIQGVFGVNSDWKITFQSLLKLKAFKGKGAKRCARSGFARGLQAYGGVL